MAGDPEGGGDEQHLDACPDQVAGGRQAGLADRDVVDPHVEVADVEDHEEYGEGGARLAAVPPVHQQGDSDADLGDAAHVDPGSGVSQAIGNQWLEPAWVDEMHDARSSHPQSQEDDEQPLDACRHAPSLAPERVFRG